MNTITSRIPTNPIEGDLATTNMEFSCTRVGYSSSDQAQQNQAGSSGSRINWLAGKDARLSADKNQVLLTVPWHKITSHALDQTYKVLIALYRDEKIVKWDTTAPLPLVVIRLSRTVISRDPVYVYQPISLCHLRTDRAELRVK